MPSNTVINRRNVGSVLSRKTVLMSDEAAALIAELAKTLSVSQGSLIDTALREIAAQQPAEIIDQLYRHGHLTDTERDAVVASLPARRRRKTR